jgi:two-component system, NtrC family, sensor histidine kinase HydH
MKLGLPAGVDAPLARRLAALTFLRLLVLVALLVIVERVYLQALPFGGFSSIVALLTVAVAFSMSALYTLALRSGRWLAQIAIIQLVTDQLTWTAIVYISGGVTSGSTSLYGLTCVTGAILVGTRGVAWAAGVGMVSYAALSALLATGTISPPPDQPIEAYVVEPQQMAYPVFSTLVATALVSMLASYLADRLRVFGGRLEKAERRAEEAEHLALLGRLAAALAHEIRNPLGSIRGSIELLRTGGTLDEEDRNLCEIIERETARLNDLVTDMLDLSRPREPDLHEIDLAEIATGVVELAERAGAGSEISVRYEGPRRISVRADPAQMRQLLWNLVRNAIQASEEGAEVVVTIEPDGTEGATLRVRDQGTGIPSSKRDQIFEAFYTTRSHGVGIGLAVVKQVSDAHGFELDVDSAEGEGTSVTVLIPKSHLVALIALLAGCSGGQDWVRDGGERETIWWADDPAGATPAAPTAAASAEPAPSPPSAATAVTLDESANASAERYRNTYYDFPADLEGAKAAVTAQIFDARCAPISTVSKIFHDAVCVQGSGKLSTGETVSFARRDCDCAAECPRTGQRICFEKLDPKRFPHGRGARGTAITPLRSVAVDPEVVPLGTALYIPEYQGLRGPDGKTHDGCFLAEDRGLKVKGHHVDIFTGDPSTTVSWNRAVPSNQGVRVIIGATRCAHLTQR